MFEQKRAAKAKKPMQILQEVTQNTMDSTALVSSAITYAPRVVCKVDHRQRQWSQAPSFIVEQQVNFAVWVSP